MRSAEQLGLVPEDQVRIDRAVLRDPALQRQLEDVGYVTVPFLEPHQVAALNDGYDRLAAELDGPNAPGDHNETYAEFTVIHSRPEFRRRAFELITSVVQPVAERHLIDHRPLIANFVNKSPGTGVVPTHQNFSVVDEARFRSVSVWLALVDCTMANGAMAMLDRSHAKMRSRRGMWAYQAFGGIDQAVLDGYLTPVEVPAGHAVILDDALVHYSPPNTTASRRLAIQYVMVPQEATALWFQEVGGDADTVEVDIWEVDERFFFEFWHGDGDDRYGRVVGRISIPRAGLDLDSMRAILGEEP